MAKKETAEKGTVTKLSTAKRARRARIGITMEPGELARIDALISTVAQSEAAREFGVEVDRSLVLRIAVIRGLAVMEAGAASPRSVSASSAETKKVEKPVEKKAAAEPKEDDSVKRDGDGNVLPPSGWNEWKPAEKVPESHAAVHEYYMNKGWRRFWGSSPTKKGDESIAFYWTGDERLQDVEPFEGVGADGSKILVQKTPYGVGHIIPHSWAAA